MSSVSKKAFRATIWVAANTYLSTAVTFVSSIFLARLLEPATFGIFALGLFFLEAVGRVREFGFDQALMHRQKDLSKAFSTHFILQFTVSLCAFAVALIAWPILTRFYDPLPVSIFVVLSLVMVFDFLGRTQRVFLEKELAFGKTSAIDFTALLLSVIVGLACAFKGFGVWSLVALKATNHLTVFLGLWAVGLWRIQPRQLRVEFDKEIARWFIKFGAVLWVGGTATFVLYKYNDWVLGTFVGAAALGFYTKALSFAQMPTSLVTSVVSKVALPTYAKVQHEKEKLGKAFNLVLAWILRFSVPISLILFLTAEEFTLMLIGEKWLPMVPIFKMLIVYSLIRPIFDDTGAFLTAIGKPKIMTKIISIQAVCLVILAPFGVWKYGALGGAGALNIVMILGIVMAYTFVNRFVKVQFKRIFLPTAGVLAGTAIAFSIGLDMVSLQGISLVGLFFAKACLAGVLYVFFTALLEFKIIKEDLQYLKTLFPQLPFPGR
jgi:PST family polysaccharide transporter